MLQHTTFFKFSSQAQTTLATLGPIGYFPKAPGTIGSMVAVFLAPFCFLPLSMPLRLAVLTLIFLGGSLCATKAEKFFQQKDPHQVVIDELLGQWLVFLPCTQLAWYELLVGLIFFRFFDIYKPRPIRDSEIWLEDGWGVMLDDAIAGMYALLCLYTFLFITRPTALFFS